MRVWLACFLVLFALAELFDWVKGFSLPLPIYILGGAFLAIASNYNKLFASYFSHTPSEQLHIDSQSQSTPSISFTIPRPQKEAQQSEVEKMP